MKTANGREKRGNKNLNYWKGTNEPEKESIP